MMPRHPRPDHHVYDGPPDGIPLVRLEVSIEPVSPDGSAVAVHMDVGNGIVLPEFDEGERLVVPESLALALLTEAVARVIADNPECRPTDKDIAAAGVIFDPDADDGNVHDFIERFGP